MVKNPPSNAGDAGLIPGQGTKIPHIARRLSPHTTTKEPACCNYRAHALWSLCTTTTEPMCAGACAPLERSLHAATKGQTQPKMK